MGRKPKLKLLKWLSPGMETIPVLLYLTFLVSCGQENKTNTTTTDSIRPFSDSNIVKDNKPSPIYKEEFADTLDDKTNQWVQGLLINYIQNSDNEATQYALHQKLNIQWILDKKLNTDSARYFVIHIGQDVRDSDGCCPRFVSDEWIYVDSAKRKIYCLDIPNQKIFEWVKKNDSLTVSKLDSTNKK